ncbi:MAG: universal stress protein [Dehalococcoidia bacterium]
MYNKVLVPLDKSKEAEKVLPLIKSQLDPDGEIILLHIIPFFKSLKAGDHVVPGHQREEAERVRAMDYLRSVAKGLSGDQVRCRCEVFVSDSVAEGIMQVATQWGVDAVAMYTHDRKGLAKLIKGSIAEKVRRTALIQVKVFKPQQLLKPA